MDKKEFETALADLKSKLEENLSAKMKAEVAAQIKSLEDQLKALEKTGTDVKGLQDSLAELKTAADANQEIINQVSVLMKNGQLGKEGTDKPKSFGLHIAHSMTEVKEAIAQMASGKQKAGIKHALSEKAVADMTTATHLGGGAIPNTYRNEIIPQPFELVHFRNLVAVTPSATDSYHFYRHEGGEGDIDFQGGENNTKEQIDEDLSEQTVNLDYLAGWLRISKKMLRNFPALQSYLSRWLPERYYQAEDVKAYASLKAAASGTAVATGNVLDRIIGTMGVQKQAKYAVNGIVVNGLTWAQLLTVKATGSGEYNLPNVVTISPTGQVLILGVPVFTASWVDDNEAALGDWRMFEIIQSEALSLNLYEQDGTNVRENKVTALIEASVGFANLQPKAFSIVDTTPEA